MFGDSGFVNVFTSLRGESGMLAAWDTNKIADNGSVLPKNRVYFDYRLFDNAQSLTNPMVGASGDISRYRVGVERVFGVCDDWSIEFRLPFTGGGDIAIPDLSYGFGGVGNLSVILKRVLTESDTTVTALGFAVNAPTGADATISIPSSPDTITIHNEAVQLMPWVGLLHTPDERFFHQAFAQLQFAANGNSVSATGVGGVLTDQTLLFLDWESGYWIKPHCPDHGMGVAAVFELHYTGTLQSPDLVAGLPPSPAATLAGRSVNVVNMTGGFHVAVGERMTLRTGVSVPLTGSADRFFDTEGIGTLIVHW
jgi:hypothetical protein